MLLSKFAASVHTCSAAASSCGSGSAAWPTRKPSVPYSHPAKFAKVAVNGRLADAEAVGAAAVGRRVQQVQHVRLV